jgi:hypothetical protein
MYYSRIKPKFRERKFVDKEYAILFDVGSEKVMIYDEEKGLIYDLYKNKLETPQQPISFDDFVLDYDLILTAKREQYVIEYNIEGLYRINDLFLRKMRKNGFPLSVTNLNVSRIDDKYEEERLIFPSRFKVYKLIDKDTGEVLSGSATMDEA